MSTNSSPLVSVGLTTYRRPDGVAKVLEGLLAQTHQNLEILVSDNCSNMEAVDKVLAEFEQRDKRIRAFKQSVNLGMQGNHAFVAHKASGEFFLWLHDDDDIPLNYIERALERFSDAPDILLVGPRADAYMEGKFWYHYHNYSSVGMSVYERLRELIPIGYTYSSAFQQYFFGVYRLSTLKDLIWEDGKYYHKETFSLVFRISERGTIHFAEDVLLKKYNVQSDFKKWRDKNYVTKPKRYKLAGSKAEEFIPMTLWMFRTIYRSDKLSASEKLTLMAMCCSNFFFAMVKSPTPLWKRIALIPFRILRKILHLANRALGMILRA